MSVRPLHERRGVRAWAVTLSVALLAAGAAVLGSATAANAATVKAFTLDYSQQIYGDFVEAGNSSVVCPTAATANPTTGNGNSAAQCATAQARQQTTFGNDNYNMQWSNPSAGVLNSSQAELQIPTGASVAFARLNWSGNTGVLENTAGNGQTAYPGCGAAATAKLPAIDPAAAYGNYSTEPISLVANGTTSTYSPAANLQTDSATGLAASQAQYYSTFADVTAQLQGLTSGSEVPLTVQNLWSPTGFNCYGGWSLIVVWSFPVANATYSPVKHLVNIYNGHVRQQSNDADTTISIPNLKLASSSARIGVTGYEGDYNISGDELLVGTQPGGTQAVPDPLTSGNTTPTTNNFFVGDAEGNGTWNGNTFTPGPANVFSVDAKTFTTNLIAPNANTSTTASFTFRTTSDSYVAQELAFSAAIPDIVVTKTTATKIADHGGTAQFTITVTNPTPSAITNVTASDPSSPGCSKTIGTLAGNASVTYTCTGNVPDDGSTSYTNVVTATGTDYTGSTVTGSANATVISVIHPAITLTKTADKTLYATGGTVTYTITAKNTGDSSLSGVAVTDTNASGCAKTIGTLAAGASSTYTCTTTAPVAGGSNVAAVSATDPAGGTVSASATAPTPTAGSVSGNVFADLNNDGVQGSGETGIPGVTMTLTPTTGNALTTTSTSNGGFTFAGVAPGTYTLTETQPTGYAQGKDTAGTNATVVSGKTDTFTVTVPDAGSSAGTAFGEIPSDSLAGTVYVDANDDGVRQSGEAGVTGVTLNLTGADDAGNPVSLSTPTTSAGAYSFPALRPGTYSITEVQPAGYVQGKDAAGTPAGVTTTQDVISGIKLTGTNTAGTGYNFGELIASSVSGTVQTDHSTGLAGVTVTLTGTDDNGAAVSTTTTTLAGGTYVFTGLRPGSYAVTEAQPTAYGAGSVTAGPTGGTISGANQVNAITLPSNTSASGYAFVDTTGSVTGFVFSDANNDGAKAATGEPGLGGTTVTLQGTGGGGTSTARTFNLTTTTLSDGSFSFPDLPAGTAYTLSESTPPSYLNGKDTAGSGGGTYAAPDTFSGVTVTAGTAASSYLFGEVAPGSLTGTVTDQNGNPEVGVKVDLGGTATAVATTASDGSYSLTGLYPGTYTLTEEQPTGLGNGTDTVGKVNGTASGTAGTVNSITAITVPAGGVGTGYVFTDVAGSLAGHAYVDANGNGAYDTGEATIAAVTVTLSKGGATVATTTTGSDGTYTFSGLAAGSYTLTETQPSGYFEGSASAGTPPGTVTGTPDVVSAIPLTSGTAGTGYDFGDLLAASLAGTVSGDQGNPIANVTVTASGKDTQGNTIAAVSVKTGTDGSWAFPGLAPGTYQVVESQPAAYGDTATTPATAGTAGGTPSGTNTITGIILGSKAAATGYAFVDSTATISGSVYVDANGDGVRQAGETGITPVTVTLSGGPGNTTVSKQTVSDGSFSFAGLAAGTYVLTEAQPNGYSQGVDQAGTPTDGTVTQSPTTDTVSAITVGAGATLPGYTFGEYSPTGLSGTVTDDQGNPLRAVTVSIKNSAGTVVATSTTNNSGAWSVLTLAPGTYEIDESQPAGYGNGSAIVGTVNGAAAGTAATATPNAITGVTIASGQTGVNYQFVDTSGTVSGTVFVDANGNNALDGGEAGISGVTVTATGTVGGVTVTRTGTSTSTGGFAITGLPAGTYTVTESQPGGYTSGTDTAGSSGTAAADGVTFTTVVVGAGATDAGYLYPEYVPASVAGLVQDGAGNPIAGVTVTVKSAGGTTTTATTGATGAWSVTGLVPGTYSVIESQPADYGTGTDAVGTLGGTVTDGNTVSAVPVTSGAAGTKYTFTDVAGTLGGTVFLDKNNDGVQQSGDTGIGGVTLTVTGTTTSSKAAITRTGTTAADGTFTVTGLPAGTYQLVETQPPGYTSGKDTAGTPTGTLSGTDTFSGITMGVATTGTGYTFAEYTTATVAGVVRDTTFNGLPGATVTLADGNGHTYTPTIGSDGTWTATGVVPGTYTITETDPSGYGDVNAAAGTDGGTVADANHITGVTVAAGSAGTGYTFVDRLGSLSGSVFVDANGNGVRDSGENGIQNVVVTLSDSGGTVKTTTTDSSGNYTFAAIAGGTYTITETQPAAYAEGKDAAGTPAGSVTKQDVTSGIVLPNGTVATGYTFGEESPGSIAGTATVGGAGEGGVTVTLTGTTDQGLTITPVTATTAVTTGAYSFPNVAPGTYTVTETQPASYGAGAATAGSAGGTVNGANQVTTIALGQGVAATGYAFTDSPASISGFVFSDANGNNAKDTGERGLATVAVSATLGGTTYSTTTASDGSFTFSNLPAGSYTVNETQPSGYSSGTDSAPSGSFSGDTLSNLNVLAGSTVTGILYPETTTAALSGGVQDSAGNPLKNVTVTAYLNGATTGTAVVTDAQGSFAFPTLTPGTYVLTETQPAGYGNGTATAGPTSTTDGSGGGTPSADGNTISGVTVISGDRENGYLFTDTSSYLTGAVFVDANGSSTRDSGETGIATVTVTATGTSGPANGTTFTATTGSDGTFTVSGLLSGTYTLTETQPAGYLSGTDTAGTPTSGTASADGVTVTGITVPVNGTVGGYLYPEYQNGALSGTVATPVGAGIAHATITVTNAGGTVVGTTTSAADGTWSVTGLAPGTDTVTETDAATYGSVSATPGNDGGTTTDPNTIVGVKVVSGGTGTGYGFVDTLGTISGSVYVDANHNGVVDTGETPIANVTVTLSSGGTTVATAQSKANGTYTFTGVVPGTYALTETQPTAYAEGLDTAGTAGNGGTATQDVISGIALAAGKTAAGNLFGEETFGSLTGTVSLDGTVENAISVTLAGTTDTGAAFTQSVLTNGGQFSFTAVPPGSAYTLSESQPAPYGDGVATAGTSSGAPDGTVTGPNSVGSIAIAQGASATGYAFTDTGAQIMGTVFVDRNGDGVDSAGDTGIADVTVTATDSSGDSYSALTTNMGAFDITVLAAGSYTLTETQPAGYSSGQDTAGSFHGTFVAPDTFTGVAVPAGGAGTGYTFAEYVPSTLGGSVVDSTGKGIANVVVTLSGPSGTFTLTTGSDGTWKQTGLAPGTYTLAQTQPSQYGAGSATPGSDGGTATDTDDIGAIAVTSGSNGTGYTFTDTLGSIAGAVYLDANANGVRDGSETGIQNVTITLTGGGLTTPLTTPTLNTGGFSFPDLLAGTYTVTETQPAGYAQGRDSAGTPVAGVTTTQDVVSGVALAGGVAETGVRFGEESDGSVAGTVAVGGVGESGITMTINGTTDQGAPFSTTTLTTGTGNYTFATVPPGSYTVAESQPTRYGNGTAAIGNAGGTVSSDGNSVSGIVLNQGIAATGYAFTDVGATIAGRVFDDRDGDNAFDGADTGLTGDTITATGTNGTYTATTTAGGAFTLANLPVDTYVLTEQQPNGYASGADSAGTTGGTVAGDTVTGVTPTAGGSYSGVLFPEHTTSAVAGTVLDDQGRPVVGVTITVTGGGARYTGTTAGDGSWSIPGIPPGTYTVTESQPAGYGAGSAAATKGDGTVNGPDEIDDVVVNDATATFGGYAFTDATTTVAGSVFDDLNNDGVQGSNEAGISGVTVDLVNPSTGTVVATGTTGTDGSFTIKGLVAGSYTLFETQPGGYASGIDTAGTDGGTPSPDGTSVTGVVVQAGVAGSGYLFAEYKAATLGGTVVDSTGKGIANVTVLVEKPDGTVVASIPTDGMGNWSDTAIVPGTYQIAETQPTAYGAGSAVLGTGDGGAVSAGAPNLITGVTVTSGSIGRGYGFVDQLGSLSGSVYLDADGDGIRDGGDGGIATVTVTLNGPNIPAAGISTPTDAAGNFVFPNLVGGSYTITETQPPGYTQGVDTVGSDGGTVSGSDIISGIALGGGDVATGYLFGEETPSSIGGTVMVGGDPEPGVVLDLTGTDDRGNAVTQQATVGPTGRYTFTGVPRGTYAVAEEQPAAYGNGTATVGSAGGTVATDGNSVTTIVLSEGTAATGYAFTDVAGTIAGRVYVDDDGSNTFTTGDTGLGSVSVTATDATGTVYRGTTASDGTFTVGGLPAGTYTLAESPQPAGFTSGTDGAGTTGGTVSGDSITSITIAPGAMPAGVSFPEYQTGSIGGTVLLDTGGGATGVTIDVYSGSTLVGTTTTTGTGMWTVSGLVPGTYTVREVQPAAYGDGSATPGAAGGTTNGPDEIDGVPVTSNGAVTGYGFTDTTATVGGTVYVDADGDGTYEPATDSPLVGVPVMVLDAKANVVGTAKTLADGSFAISGLPAGTYTLVETQPQGYLSGADAAGAFGGSPQPDGTTVTGVVVTAGSTGGGYTYAEYKATSLSGFVTDQYGHPLVKVGLTITSAGGATVATATTSGSGAWLVTTLPPGTYTVTETQPAGYGDGTAAPGTGDGGAAAGANAIAGVTVRSGSTGAAYDFTDPSAALSGYVFTDTNGDGVEDGSETGIPNVPIKVEDASGAVVGMPTTTVGDGSWSITGLPAGTYTVVETQPDGYANGTDTVGTVGGATDGTDDGNGTSISAVALGAGVSGTGYVFAEYVSSSLGGTILDSAGNPLVGVPVTVTDGNGNAYPTTTGKGGAWSIANLPPGTYSVTETQPVGYGTGTAAIGSLGGVQGTDAPGNEISGVVVTSGSSGTGYGFTDAAATVRGSVFTDTDGDGVQDGAEPGLGNQTVTLSGGGLAKPVSTLTDSTGAFSFTGLVAGTYTLTETQPTGYVSGTDTAGTGTNAGNGTVGTDGVTISAIDVTAGSTDPGYGYAEYKATTVSGTVTADVGGGIGGVTITATDASGDPFTAVTSSDPMTLGQYTLALPPGTYTLTETQPTGYGTGSATVGSGDGGTATDGNTITGVNVLSGSTGTAYGFTDTTSSVAGTVTASRSDGTTPGITGVVVTVADANGKTVASTFTDGMGNYRIDGLLAGTYTVTMSTPAGYAPDTATAGTPAGVPSADRTDVSDITLGDGQAGSGYDFGEAMSSLSGVVFLDQDNDGVQETGELGLVNVAVTVTNTATGVSYPATTGTDGSWSVTDLLAGTYSVTETQPAGYANGKDTAGLGGGTFRAPDTFTGVAVAPGTPETGYTFGEQQSAITGQVYLDTNGDTVHQADEKPLGEVTIDLENSAGVVVLTTKTAADGTYSFPALGAGTYTVVEVQPAGYGSTTPNQQPITLTGSSGANVDFGDRGGSIGSSVWMDTDRDGVREAGEAGVAGVTLALHDAAGTVIATTVSAADGSYSFTDLPAGSYTVSVVPPKGDVVTTEGKGTPATGSAFSPTTLSTAPISIAVDASGTIGTAPAENAGLAIATPDLAVTLQGPGGPVKIGTPVTSTVTVTDTGNTTEPGAVVTVTVPPDMSVTDASGKGYTCTIGARSSSGTIVTCALATTLLPGQVAAPLTITTLPLSAGTTPISVTVRPTAGGGDVVPTNNIAVMGLSIVSDPVVTVPPTTPTAPVTPLPIGAGPSLPFTGLNAGGLVTMAVLSLLGGLGLLLFGRRRRRRSDPLA